MKILVTGGDGKFAQALKNQNSELYYTPGKFQLNLLETESVKRYTSIITEVDGIILNAINIPNEPTDWFNEQQIKEFNDVYTLYITATNQLIQQYLPKLKFVIGLSTGLIDKRDRVGHSYGYVFGKELLVNHLFRLSCNEKYKDIKMFSINPGPMQNEKEYEFHANLMYDIVNNYDNYKSGEIFSIRNGVSNDMVEKFMSSSDDNKSKKSKNFI
jgi:hypothetical protein